MESKDSTNSFASTLEQLEVLDPQLSLGSGLDFSSLLDDSADAGQAGGFATSLLDILSSDEITSPREKLHLFLSSSYGSDLIPKELESKADRVLGKLDGLRTADGQESKEVAGAWRGLCGQLSRAVSMLKTEPEAGLRFASRSVVEVLNRVDRIDPRFIQPDTSFSSYNVDDYSSFRLAEELSNSDDGMRGGLQNNVQDRVLSIHDDAIQMGGRDSYKDVVQEVTKLREIERAARSADSRNKIASLDARLESLQVSLNKELEYRKQTERDNTDRLASDRDTVRNVMRSWLVLFTPLVATVLFVRRRAMVFLNSLSTLSANKKIESINKEQKKILEQEAQVLGDKAKRIYGRDFRGQVASGYVDDGTAFSQSLREQHASMEALARSRNDDAKLKMLSAENVRERKDAFEREKEENYRAETKRLISQNKSRRSSSMFGLGSGMAPQGIKPMSMYGSTSIPSLSHSASVGSSGSSSTLGVSTRVLGGVASRSVQGTLNPRSPVPHATRIRDSLQTPQRKPFIQPGGKFSKSQFGFQSSDDTGHGGLG